MLREVPRPCLHPLLPVLEGLEMHKDCNSEGGVSCTLLVETQLSTVGYVYFRSV